MLGKHWSEGLVMAGKASWAALPKDMQRFAFPGDALKKAWSKLHTGDQEPYPDKKRAAALLAAAGKQAPKGLDADALATASALPDFSILVEAVVAAGLVTTLQGTGPFTVFAPTNAAFAALLTELGVSKADLLANTALLTKVLTYHVVPARVLKAEVPTNTAITTVQGQSFTVSTSLVITDQNMRTSNITAADVFTSNGVIHVVDKVILPK